MQSAWEHKVRYDLSESGVEALTLEEITRDPKELLRTPLGYAEGVGREETRALVASFHAGHGADDVVITTGTSEANFIALGTLVSAGDEVVVVMPNYMQLHGVATALGARVREVWLREERSWTIDLDALAAAVNARTKAICVCTPNNPTGQILSAGEIGAIVRVAERHGAWIVADEVYRGAERSAEESPSFSGRGELVTGWKEDRDQLPGLGRAAAGGSRSPKAMGAAAAPRHEGAVQNGRARLHLRCASAPPGHRRGDRRDETAHRRRLRGSRGVVVAGWTRDRVFADARRQG